MSESQEPLADPEVDTEAAMREMMGFSSFTERPKKRHETKMTSIPSQESLSATDPHQNPNFVPVSDSRRTDNVTFADVADEHQPTPPVVDVPKSLPRYQPPKYVFQSPETGVAYTAQELDEWSRGKINERGDKVFFKPGFVVEDPWARHLKTDKDGASNADGK